MATIPHHIFSFLTNKKIEWIPRIGKRITTTRDGLLFKVFDMEFIEGQRYKRLGKIWTCIKVDNIGKALLVPVSPMLDSVYAHNPEEWQVVY